MDSSVHNHLLPLTPFCFLLAVTLLGCSDPDNHGDIVIMRPSKKSTSALSLNSTGSASAKQLQNYDAVSPGASGWETDYSFQMVGYLDIDLLQLHKNGVDWSWPPYAYAVAPFTNTGSLTWTPPRVLMRSWDAKGFLPGDHSKFDVNISWSFGAMQGNHGPFIGRATVSLADVYCSWFSACDASAKISQPALDKSGAIPKASLRIDVTLHTGEHAKNFAVFIYSDGSYRDIEEHVWLTNLSSTQLV